MKFPCLICFKYWIQYITYMENQNWKEMNCIRNNGVHLKFSLWSQIQYDVANILEIIKKYDVSIFVLRKYLCNTKRAPQKCKTFKFYHISLILSLLHIHNKRNLHGYVSLILVNLLDVFNVTNHTTSKCYKPCPIKNNNFLRILRFFICISYSLFSPRENKQGLGDNSKIL